MDGTATLPEQVRDWYAHSPRAQRSYARLRADVSSVAERTAPMAHDFWERIARLIDPQPKSTPSAEADARRQTGTPGS